MRDCHIKVYKAIREFYKEKGYSPCVRELQQMCGYSSASTVHMHLKTLKKEGYIEKEPNRSRTIKIL